MSIRYAYIMQKYVYVKNIHIEKNLCNIIVNLVFEVSTHQLLFSSNIKMKLFEIFISVIRIIYYLLIIH